MNTKLLEGYIGYTTYLDTSPHDFKWVIELYSGKWWKPNKRFKYPVPKAGVYMEECNKEYHHALSIVEEYFQ